MRPLASLTSALAWKAALSSATEEEAAPFAHAVPALIDECRSLICFVAGDPRLQA